MVKGGEPEEVRYLFNSSVGHPHPPPQPPFRRLAIARATIQVTVTATTRRAAMVWAVGDMAVEGSEAESPA
jgi:hypothetical protein